MYEQLRMIAFVLALVSCSVCINAQTKTTIKGDDTTKKKWADEFSLVSIPSTRDGKIQKAYYYQPTNTEPRPLVISLHSWSGDYTQQDSLSVKAVQNGWNYIHPDFRGPNNTFEACGSPSVISDIEDAIAFALKNGNVDSGNIHLVGGSGGGYATLLMYMKSKHPIRSFSAWVPISDLTEWYFQSVGRKNKYANDILLSTNSKSDQLNLDELKIRSPLQMDTPLEARSTSNLYIYAGIHDGYEGSVPITHSLDFYNKAVSDIGGNSSDLISAETIRDLLSMRSFPSPVTNTIAGRDIIFKRHYKNIQVVIFEGKHEMLLKEALPSF